MRPLAIARRTTLAAKDKTFGYIVDWTGNWQLPFIGSLGLLLLGASMAFTMHPERAFDAEVPPRAATV